MASLLLSSSSSLVAVDDSIASRTTTAVEEDGTAVAVAIDGFDDDVVELLVRRWMIPLGFLQQTLT